MHRDNGGNGSAPAEEAALGREASVIEAVAEPVAPPVIEAQITQVIDEADAPKARRATRARKTAPAGEKKKSAAPRRKKAQ